MIMNLNHSSPATDFEYYFDGDYEDYFSAYTLTDFPQWLLTLNKDSQILSTNAVHFSPPATSNEKGHLMLHVNHGILPIDPSQWYIADDSIES